LFNGRVTEQGRTVYIRGKKPLLFASEKGDFCKIFDSLAICDLIQNTFFFKSVGVAVFISPAIFSTRVSVKLFCGLGTWILLVILVLGGF